MYSCRAILLRLRLRDLITLSLGMNMGVRKPKVRATPAATEVGKGGGVVVTKVIGFYVPKSFRRPLKGASEGQCAKVIEFCIQLRKSS